MQSTHGCVLGLLDCLVRESAKGTPVAFSMGSSASEADVAPEHGNLVLGDEAIKRMVWEDLGAWFP